MLLKSGEARLGGWTVFIAGRGNLQEQLQVLDRLIEPAESHQNIGGNQMGFRDLFAGFVQVLERFFGVAVIHENAGGQDVLHAAGIRYHLQCAPSDYGSFVKPPQLRQRDTQIR